MVYEKRHRRKGLYQVIPQAVFLTAIIAAHAPEDVQGIVLERCLR